MHPELEPLRWLEIGCPGPSVILPYSLLSHWSGSLPPKDGRTIEAEFRWESQADATDYDRACDVSSMAAVIPIGPGEGLVLHAEGVMPVAWVPLGEGGGMLANLYTLESATLPETLPDLPSDLTWRYAGDFSADTSPLRLMHATEAGDEAPVFDTLDIPLQVGRYRVETSAFQNPQMELWLVRLSPLALSGGNGDRAS